jgi:hypothetical protein
MSYIQSTETHIYFHFTDIIKYSLPLAKDTGGEGRTPGVYSISQTDSGYWC